jgi:protein-disulfide isomerase
MDRAAHDSAALGPVIEQYLIENPRVLERVSSALTAKVEAERLDRAKASIAAIRDDIFADPASVVVGNPDGDVTLVEMYDYNCGFCRSSFPDLVALLDQDPKLRVVLKQFPILSEGSVQAARVGVVVAQSGADYWAFHQALFTGRGLVDGEMALRAAETLGLVADEVRIKASGPDVTAEIEKSYEIARVLEVSGTPTFIIGDEIIPGAVGLEALREKIANMRACGKSICG